MRNFILFLSFLTAFSLKAQDCSDLFISEYAEGPHNNNAIEIYNPTAYPINLSGYTINRYSNGATNVANSHIFSLSGSIAAGDVVVVGNGQLDSVWVPSGSYWSLPVEAGFYGLLNDYCNGDYDANSTFYFNGNDAITLEYNGNTVDIFGKVGEDPGQAWTSDTSAGFTDVNGGDWWSKRHTLIRKSTVKKGVTVNPLLFNPVVEYNLLPDSTFTELGIHICDCASSMNLENFKNISYVMYPNPVKNGNNVSFSSTQPIKEIRLINMVGQKFLFNNKIDVSDFSSGTYIIEIEFENGFVELNKLVIE